MQQPLFLLPTHPLSCCLLYYWSGLALLECPDRCTLSHRLPLDELALENYKCAICTVGSRAMNFTLPDGKSFRLLAPFADMLNHSLVRGKAVSSFRLNPMITIRPKV